MSFGLLATHNVHLISQKVGHLPDIMALLYDGEHFTRKFFPVLVTSSLQVYCSALLFTPRQTLLHETYGHELAPICKGVEEAWHLCTRTIEGHSYGVSSVVFSLDSKCIVSGSLDNTIRLWDAVSGAHLNTLEGHSGGVYSVSFSPDGKSIVSGSSDNTIRLWDAVSGAHLNTLEGHSGSV